MSAATAAREENLRTANRIRLARAAHRRQIGAVRREVGEGDVAMLLVDPPEWILSARVAAVLTWPKGRGDQWASDVCRKAGLPRTATVGWLAENRGPLFEVLPRLVAGRRVWTWDRTIDFLRYRASVMGRTPTLQEFEALLRSRRGSGGPISSLFGSYTALVEVAGLEPTPGGGVAADDAVPTVVLREAFERSGLTAVELARRLGWWSNSKGRVRGDDSRVLRTLGMKCDLYRGQRVRRRRTRHETAERLLKAMDLDPVDVGL